MSHRCSSLATDCSALPSGGQGRMLQHVSMQTVARSRLRELGRIVVAMSLKLG